MKKRIIILLTTLILLLSGCSNVIPEPEVTSKEVKQSNISVEIPSKMSESPNIIQNLPEYNGVPSIVINNHIPSFTEEEKERGKESFIELSDLDALGRCGPAFASVSTDTMPSEERGNIGSVKPTGWHTVKYEGIDGNYLYNRCHLLMYALTGLNAEPKNLITGTRYLNIEGNLPIEEKIVSYIKTTGNHVLYRVTPVFEGNNLLCSGELMEAYSIEDNGKLSICVYCFNVQPGITIDYATGNSSGPEYTGLSKSENNTAVYVLNTYTKKIHKQDCENVGKISDKNKKDYTGNIEELLNEGYTPCKSCNP